jgi:hypothetical protein
MAKEFYTEKDIEDMVKRGILTLQVSEDVVLTELAYEKANRLGMELVRGKPLEPPAAPIRPYISAISKTAGSPLPADSKSQPALPERIRSAVIARLGNQVDSALLDNIIKRVLNSTGVK